MTGFRAVDLRRTLAVTGPLVLRDRMDPFPLEALEREVPHWVARGLTNDEVARRLSLSPHTVRAQFQNSYRKLGVHTRTEAATRVRS